MSGGALAFEVVGIITPSFNTHTENMILFLSDCLSSCLPTGRLSKSQLLKAFES